MPCSHESIFRTFWSTNSQKNGANRCTSDFKTKMHQIRFPLGLRPRPRWWSSQRPPPKPISWLSAVLLLREKRKGEGREDRERGKGERGKRGKKGKEGKGQGKGRKRKRRKKAEKEKGKGKRRKRNKKRIGLWPRKGLIRLCMRRAKNEATALDRSGRWYVCTQY